MAIRVDQSRPAPSAAPAPAPARMARSRWSRVGESLINGWICFCGFTAILFVVLIFFFVFREALPLLRQYPLAKLLGTEWVPAPPTEEELPDFGLIPLLLGSLQVTLGAIVLAVPLGLMSAVFISEIAPAWLRNILKPMVELLAAIPSVVLGFFGAVVVAGWLRSGIGLGFSGLTALTGSLLLALMAIPTIATISEDALSASALNSTRFSGTTGPSGRTRRCCGDRRRSRSSCCPSSSRPPRRRC